MNLGFIWFYSNNLIYKTNFITFNENWCNLDNYHTRETVPLMLRKYKSIINRNESNSDRLGSIALDVLRCDFYRKDSHSRRWRKRRRHENRHCPPVDAATSPRVQYILPFLSLLLLLPLPFSLLLLLLLLLFCLYLSIYLF